MPKENNDSKEKMNEQVNVLIIDLATEYIEDYGYRLDEDEGIALLSVKEYIEIAAKEKKYAPLSDYRGDVAMQVFSYARQIWTATRKKEPKDVPLKNLINFSEYMPLFQNTHAHLQPCFDKLDNEVQLYGAGYYPIKKVLCYMTESMRQETQSQLVGSVPIDNRLHIGLILAAGRGKGQIKEALKEYNQSKYQKCINFPAARINIEQLVGRTFKEKGVTKEERGYLNYKCLMVDECQDLVAEKEKTEAANIMLEFRGAAEVWHKNTVQKKLTADEMMEYDPEVRFLFLLHYPNFPAVYFDRGTARRVLMFRGGTDPIPMSAGTDGLRGERKTEDFKIYINTPQEFRGLSFDSAATAEIIEWIDAWNSFVLMHKNQRVRALGQKNFTSVKDIFLRLASILSIRKMEGTVSARTIIQSGIDAFHFLLCTYEIYANESQINLSRDVWRTTDAQEAMLFEWMHYNGAVSEKVTPLSIVVVQDKIGEIFGVQDRQAKGIFSRLVEGGKIGRKQEFQASKAWLQFTPELEGGVALEARTPINIPEFISQKKAIMDAMGAEVHPTFENTKTLNTPVIKNNSNKLLEYKEVANVNTEHTTAPIAPITPKLPNPSGLLCGSCGSAPGTRWVDGRVCCASDACRDTLERMEELTNPTE